MSAADQVVHIFPSEHHSTWETIRDAAAGPSKFLGAAHSNRQTLCMQIQTLQQLAGDDPFGDFWPKLVLSLLVAEGIQQQLFHHIFCTHASSFVWCRPPEEHRRRSLPMVLAGQVIGVRLLPQQLWAGDYGLQVPRAEHEDIVQKLILLAEPHLLIDVFGHGLQTPLELPPSPLKAPQPIPIALHRHLDSVSQRWAYLHQAAHHISSFVSFPHARPVDEPSNQCIEPARHCHVLHQIPTENLTKLLIIKESSEELHHFARHVFSQIFQGLLHPDFFAQFLLWIFLLWCIAQALRSVAHSLLFKEAIPIIFRRCLMHCFQICQALPFGHVCAHTAPQILHFQLHFTSCHEIQTARAIPMYKVGGGTGP
mmetsp:Transcript_34644/g.55360  ORF Transcript_34644/g.55360 Transcript_34644/m.55360 type:complete len:367 (-) Transcript_34644:79-1179(-)